jgi:hypothetical protein
VLATSAWLIILKYHEKQILEKHLFNEPQNSMVELAFVTYDIRCDVFRFSVTLIYFKEPYGIRVCITKLFSFLMKLVRGYPLLSPKKKAKRKERALE